MLQLPLYVDAGQIMWEHSTYINAPLEVDPSRRLRQCCCKRRSRDFIQLECVSAGETG